MKRNSLLLLAFSATTLFASVAGAQTLYSNPWDGQGNLSASQNDTTGGNGNFAACYGYFTTGGAQWSITDVHFTGGYFNPPTQGQITGFTVNIYGDGGNNTVGGLLGTSHINAGSFTETSLGSVGGFPVFKYDMNLVNKVTMSGVGWLSVVPDLGFPPQWGWASGTDTSAVAMGYQDFFGSRSRLGNSLAFDLTGTVVPEPASITALAIGALAMVRRRKAAKK